MRLLILLVLCFFNFSFVKADPTGPREAFSLPADSEMEQQRMCTAFTGAKIARFNQCVSSSEVMVGIRSLDPLIVYCSNLVVNCRKEGSDPDSTNIEEKR